MDDIRHGELKVGMKMPTERELSQRLKISRNTVSTAYKELENEGILKSYQGRGTFVAEEVKTWTEKDSRDKIIKLIDLGFEEAMERGISAEEFIEIVKERVEEKKNQINNMTAIYVECNIEQAKMFSKQLSENTGMTVLPLTIKDIINRRSESIDVLEKAKLIVTTFNHVEEVENLVNDYNIEVYGVAIKPNLETIVRIARYPDNTKFACFCISNEFIFKIQQALEAAGLYELIIKYSNSFKKEEVKEIMDSSNIIIVSPGRYKEISELNTEHKEMINFLYSLDEGSVNALKSKIIDMK